MTAQEQIRLRQVGLRVITLQSQVLKLRLKVIKLKRQSTIDSYNQIIICHEIEIRKIKESSDFKLWWYGN